MPVELQSGDHMDREEFNRIYEQMPEDFKAELIGGIVYVSPPLSINHGEKHLGLGSLIFQYQTSTPGTRGGDNVTVRLGRNSQPQPDLYLRILPEFGGQTKGTGAGPIDGPPELVAEIAHSSQAIDLHGKRRDYAENGVHEYLVLLPNEQQLKWFDLRTNQELSPDADGICRIRSFPGLWIHVDGLLQLNGAQMAATLQLGLATPEHAAFVTQLARNRKK